MIWPFRETPTKANNLTVHYRTSSKTHLQSWASTQRLSPNILCTPAPLIFTISAGLLFHDLYPSQFQPSSHPLTYPWHSKACLAPYLAFSVSSGLAVPPPRDCQGSNEVLVPPTALSNTLSSVLSAGRTSNTWGAGIQHDATLEDNWVSGGNQNEVEVEEWEERGQSICSAAPPNTPFSEHFPSRPMLAPLPLISCPANIPLFSFTYLYLSQLLFHFCYTTDQKVLTYF